MAFIDSHNDGMARVPDHATKALDGLQLFAEFIPTLTNPEGEFVGEITSILDNCWKVFQSESHCRFAVDNKHWTKIYKIGSWFDTCLKSLWSYGCREPRFTVYTAGLRRRRVTAMYPRSWYESKMNIYGLDDCIKELTRLLWKALRRVHIVLYVTADMAPGDPPWKFDEFLKKRLVASALSEQPLPVSTPMMNIFKTSGGQLPELKDTSGRASAAATSREQPPNMTQTSEVQQSSWNTMTFQNSNYMGSDVIEIDWRVWDRMFPSTQDGQSSISSRPPIAEVSSSQYELLQSRPPPTIQKLVPAEGTIAGGTEVTLLGSGFYQGLEIMFGDAEATLTTFWGENCLNCIVPPTSQSGSVKVRFKHELHQIFLTQQESQSRTCVYKYIGFHEVETQISGVVPESISQQQITAESGATISGSSVLKMCPVMLTNLAIMKYLAECLAVLDVPSIRNDDIQKDVGRTLLSLRCALEKGPVDDDTILSAILLWSIEKIRNDQHAADRHWEGIKVLIKLRPDFEIGVPLGRICFLASLTLTNQERNLVTKVSEIIAAALRSAMEIGMGTDDGNQSVAITSATTPAATVYSPWSETDAEPPPYILSPTPLKQACLIYAAVNAHR